MKKKMEKAGNVLCVFCALLMVWMLISFIEVNAKNLSENPVYNDYNFFVLLTE